MEKIACNICNLKSLFFNKKVQNLNRNGDIAQIAQIAMVVYIYSRNVLNFTIFINN